MMNYKNSILHASCPVCHYALAANFFDGGEQPLATLGWAKCSNEAQGMARHPLDYVQCPRCTHVWNRSFTYEAIPYVDNPNRMFNKGGNWSTHLELTRSILLSKLPPNPTIIDIGCGEGHFVRKIAETLNYQGEFIGFDPNVNSETTGLGVKFFSRYFEPLIDVPVLKPDLLIMRHVLEHLTDPANFIDQLALSATLVNKEVLFFAEMPCIDKAISSRRLVDFFYEHPSQFTTKSFESLLKQSGNVLIINHGYDGEVIYGLSTLGVPQSYCTSILESCSFYENAKVSKIRIESQLQELYKSGKKIAIWGGTGKAAAFIHYFNVNASQFPLVVDSDIDKVGTYVPKTGQLIQFKDVLKTNPVDIVIIPPQWRAKDIVAEMQRENIQVKQVLIEHNGYLIDF